MLRVRNTLIAGVHEFDIEGVSVTAREFERQTVGMGF